MKFDVIIGNPPYNNDMYLDFVQAGYNLLTDDGCMVMITPAKWQAKGGKKNDDFREKIVPHMREIVYYPEATDIFDIAEIDGISIYSVDKKHEYDIKQIRNVCCNNNLFNRDMSRPVGILTLNNTALSIAEKVNKHKKISICNKGNQYKISRPTGGNIEVLSNGKFVAGYNDRDIICKKFGYEKYRVVANEMLGYSFFLDNNGMKIGGPEYKICKPNQVCTAHYIVYNEFDSIEEADNFISYLNSKFVRFISSMTIMGTTASCKEFYRLVPDPGSLDHLFTDKELYVKYNLTQEEINIIESVIKERK